MAVYVAQYISYDRFLESHLLLMILISVVSGAIIIISTLVVFLHWRQSRHKSHIKNKTLHVDLNTVESDDEHDSDKEDHQNGVHINGSEAKHDSKVALISY